MKHDIYVLDIWNIKCINYENYMLISIILYDGCGIVYGNLFIY